MFGEDIFFFENYRVVKGGVPQLPPPLGHPATRSGTLGGWPWPRKFAPLGRSKIGHSLDRHPPRMVIVANESLVRDITKNVMMWKKVTVGGCMQNPSHS